MASSPGEGDSDAPAPFLVQLFYRNGGFYRPDDFASHTLPSHFSIYAWPHCTLNELAMELAASKPSVLPYPAVGTRISFQLVCPDLRSVSAFSSAQPRYAVKDLGSIVIGQNEQTGIDNTDFVEVGGAAGRTVGSGRTLNDAHFVVGDYISCALLPPLADGSIAPPLTARGDSNTGGRFGRGGHRDSSFHNREENGFGRPPGREARGGRRGGGMGGPPVPMGDWRRGERLPDMPPSRPRGGSRW